MTLFDKFLIVLLVLMVSILAVLVYRGVKEDPEIWLWNITKWGRLKIWNFPQKLQPKRNTDLLSRRKKKEKTSGGGVVKYVIEGN